MITPGIAIFFFFFNLLLIGRIQALRTLKEAGVKLIALRCSEVENVDLREALRLNIKVVRVPRYSPAAVAEHAVGLMMALNR